MTKNINQELKEFKVKTWEETGCFRNNRFSNDLARKTIEKLKRKEALEEAKK